MVQSILIRLGITDPGGPGKKFIHTLFLSLFIYLYTVKTSVCSTMKNFALFYKIANINFYSNDFYFIYSQNS